MSTRAFIATNKKTFLGVAAVAILYSTFGRIFMGSGTDNTLLGTIALDVLLLITVQQPVTLRGCGVSTVHWVCSAIIAILDTSLVVTAFIVTAMVIEQDKSSCYRRFDSFIVTFDPALFPDTSGELYMIKDSGWSYITILLTILCVFLGFLIATVASTAIGTVARTRDICTGLITIGMTLAALFLSSYLLDVIGSVPGAPWPAVPIFASIITVISAFAMAGASKEEERPLPAVCPVFAEA